MYVHIMYILSFNLFLKRQKYLLKRPNINNNLNLCVQAENSHWLLRCRKTGIKSEL